MRKLSFFLLPALFLAGCAQEKALPEPKTDEVGETQIFTVDELKFLSTVGKETKFEQEEIDRIVGDVVDFMDAAPSTRSATPRTVAEIVPLSVNITSP